MSEPAPKLRGPSLHTVTWKIRSEGYLDGVIKCSAVVGADCRMGCPEGCEQWPCDHELIDYGECYAVEAIDAGGDLYESYRGPDASLRDGNVDIEWDGDSWGWFYPEQSGTPQCSCGPPRRDGDYPAEPSIDCPSHGLGRNRTER